MYSSMRGLEVGAIVLTIANWFRFASNQVVFHCFVHALVANRKRELLEIKCA
jgi:hypothetical protein